MDATGSLMAWLQGMVQKGRSAREDFAMNEQLGGHRNTAEPSTFCSAEGPCWRDGAQSHHVHEGTS